MTTKRVIFFPRNDLPVKVCNHRYGAIATYSESTDTLQASSCYAVEYYAHKYGIMLGAFVNPDANTTNEMEASEKYGSMRYDIYSLGGYWYNPNTSKIEMMPDFQLSAWTQRGIDTFGYEEEGVIKINGVAVSVGSPKQALTPDHGLQVYEYSNGQYGWKDGVLGQSQGIEVTEYQKYLSEWFNATFERYASSLGYGGGKDGAASLLSQFYLGCRNSLTEWTDFNLSDTRYSNEYDGGLLGYPQEEITRDFLLSRPNSTRWWDAVNSNRLTKAQSIENQKQLLIKTIANGGWVNNFTHWHSMQSTTKEELKLSCYDEYFNALIEAIGGNHVHFCSYGEAVEYMFLRHSIDNVSAMVKNGSVIISVCVKDRFISSPNNINTPISIEIDLSGSPLADKYIKSSFGNIISLGNNKYIVEVPMAKTYDNVSQILLSESDTANYLSLSKPVISNIAFGNDTVTFNTDLPCYSCVFEIMDSNTIALVSRQTDIRKTSHSINLTKDSSKSYQIGVITEANMTNLSEMI